MRLTNASDINLPLAVWLLHDEYDYDDRANYISATSLLKPVRQAVLTSRIPPAERQADVADYIARALGHAVHDSIEKAWSKGHTRAMKLLGYPTSVIERIAINPSDGELRASNDIIPVYMEQREYREIDGWIVGGKFDMVADGVPFDHKSTSAFSWLMGTKDDDHRLQLSVYKWLNPKKITADHGTINYIFTDWSRMQARMNPKYPQKRVESKNLQLLSLEETERWVRERLRLIRTHWNDPEAKIPHCTEKELWRSDPKYKYYRDASKISGRSTKNFDDKHEAERFMAEKGGVGVVITVPGEPKACNYCPAYDLCKQKDLYL